MSEGQDPEALRRSDIRWRPNDEGRWNDHKAVQARWVLTGIVLCVFRGRLHPRAWAAKVSVTSSVTF